MGKQSPRQSLAFAALTGVVSVVPIGRASRGVRAAVAAASGVAAGGATYVALNRPDVIACSREPVPARQSAAVGAGVGALVAGVMAVGFVMDRAFEQALVRRNVPHPRLVLGVAGAVLSYALDVVDRRFDTPD